MLKWLEWLKRNVIIVIICPNGNATHSSSSSSPPPLPSSNDIVVVVVRRMQMNGSMGSRVHEAYELSSRISMTYCRT